MVICTKNLPNQRKYLIKYNNWNIITISVYFMLIVEKIGL